MLAPKMLATRITRSPPLAELMRARAFGWVMAELAKVVIFR